MFLKLNAPDAIPLSELPDAYRNDHWLTYCRTPGWIDIVVRQGDGDGGTSYLPDGAPVLQIGTLAHSVPIENTSFAGIGHALLHDPDNNPIGRRIPHVRLKKAGQMALVEDGLSRRPPADERPPNGDPMIPPRAARAHAAREIAERYGCDTDNAAYAWLVENRERAEDYVPPQTCAAFGGYVREYRRLTDTQKRRATSLRPNRSIVSRHRL